jgi:hypothetical protein
MRPYVNTVPTLSSKACERYVWNKATQALHTRINFAAWLIVIEFQAETAASRMA